MSKLRWALPKISKIRRKKKVSKNPDEVRDCDQCGNDLGRTCVRTVGSAVCAAGNGIPTANYGARDGDMWRFFCCLECMEIFEKTRIPN